MSDGTPRIHTILFAHKGGDVYGSDLQLLESISAMADRGWRVVVAVSEGGPLMDRLTARGAELRRLPYPILTKADASPRGAVRLIGSSSRALARIYHLIRELRPDLVYVNTVAVPWWLLGARLCGVPTVCHVHEAEDGDGRLALLALNAPLILAGKIIANSRASIEAMCDVAPWLRKRTQLIYNGVPGPGVAPTSPHASGGPFRLVIVGRLSPRKAQDVALEALALLRAEGRNVELEVCGTAFAGYEWFVDQLRHRSDAEDLAGHVIWSGYVAPIWPALARSHAVIAPSLREPFGNAVVEAQLAMRPVVASAAMGHQETVKNDVTGILVAPGDPRALARAVARLMDDPDLAARLVAEGRKQALSRFSTERYSRDIAHVVEALTDWRHQSMRAADQQKISRFARCSRTARPTSRSTALRLDRDFRMPCAVA